MVSGTPCQIDSLRRYINKMKCQENFVLLDFFCHGVPSKFVWDKYIKEQQDKLGNIDFLYPGETNRTDGMIHGR